MESDLRSELSAHPETLSFGFYGHHNQPSDLLDLTELFHHCPEDYIASIVRLIGSPVILFSIHPTLSAVAALFVPLMIPDTLLWGRRLRRITADIRRTVRQPLSKTAKEGSKTERAFRPTDLIRRAIFVNTESSHCLP